MPLYLLCKAVLTRTHKLCFRAKIRKNNVYSCKPRSYYIKVGFNRVKNHIVFVMGYEINQHLVKMNLQMDFRISMDNARIIRVNAICNRYLFASSVTSLF